MASQQTSKNKGGLVSGRFQDSFWRDYDRPSAGYRDSSGFVCRLPIRLESEEVILYGLVDADKMWKEFENEAFQPILVGGKAVVTCWFNNFTDTDCGGAYVETFYNTFVTKRGTKQVSLPMETPFSVLTVASLPEAQSFLIRVICSDVEGNPGAARKAIHGGRDIFGFPKHPVQGNITFKYILGEGGMKKGVAFECSHLKKKAVSMQCVLPHEKSGALVLPVCVPKTGPESCIGGPLYGGTNLGHNGALQSLYATGLKCTQIIAQWNKETDSLFFGDSDHFAPITRWDFSPTIKVFSPDFKICAHKPSGWISGEEAAKEIAKHDTLIASGIKAGAL
jgi:hypothetical protein